uniref:Uncharacterized protein n=1 Tax=Ditylenchus dipsaci TaxID=166011 RepID=A0A915DS20_9BILA
MESKMVTVANATDKALLNIFVWIAHAGGSSLPYKSRGVEPWVLSCGKETEDKNKFSGKQKSSANSDRFLPRRHITQADLILPALMKLLVMRSSQSDELDTRWKRMSEELHTSKEPRGGLQHNTKPLRRATSTSASSSRRSKLEDDRRASTGDFDFESSLNNLTWLTLESSDHSSSTTINACKPWLTACVVSYLELEDTQPPPEKIARG